jgi:hypothetical protein
MTGIEVLREELHLPHEWHLGGGGSALWTPRQPASIDLPGFVDPGTYLGQQIGPVFAITVLDRDAQPIAVRACERNWNPSRLELRYRLPNLLMTERRTVLSMDAFVSRWSLSHSAPTTRRFWMVLWTSRRQEPDGPSINEIEANPQGISFQETRRSGKSSASWGCALGASFDADSWSIDGTEMLEAAPTWETSPFADLMMPGGLPGNFQSFDSSGGQLYFALAYPFEIPAGERLDINFVAAFAPEAEQARDHLGRSASMINPIAVSEDEWANWLDELPSFTCSDRELQRCYWYRWSQHRLFGNNRHAPGTPRASGAIIESSWRHPTDEVTEAAEDLAKVASAETPFGQLARKLLSLHPDDDLRELLRETALRLASMDDSEPKLPQAPLPDPWSRLEPHEQYLSLERSVYLIDLLHFLEWIDVDHSEDWSSRAANLFEQLRAEFWDAEQSFFAQPLPSHGSIRRAKTVAGFLPLFLDNVRLTERRELFEHACDPAGFFAKCPLPSLSRDDADFDADGHWHSERLSRPMHGRSWARLTSLFIDAFGQSIEKAPANQRLFLANLIDGFARLTFVQGDFDRPELYEHYHPLTGKPAMYLGRDHHDGGWMIDHLLRYIVGIRADEEGSLVVDPLPTTLEWFSVDSLFVGNHEIEIDWDHRMGLTLRMDDETVVTAPVGRSLAVHLPDHWPAPL